ncbi:hypothetical protein [Rathayibacter iranicus]|uniref:Uncharacterized protein n=2 Tax=Rathayibacter iranicus TaxID=59737 RepID=A0AAD1AE75_9MICO|nr:hypothetical protein [Rathayibacter iranicus]AZZ55762.1 hypothetical protein C7V51_07655 [Rathayibacter iranicus]MWV30814.1 hypothetical protein [Rathayibacter iranicus NCPPB 2253 = VKM Ac-1602]PPI47530.1 hypothetical protein C5E09_06690 [Rathayibacter iranicus]PPI60375.1 hypothetical protein C5E08_07620 [Rathayibacter iranicus]PPI72158.1 hypothetical protein C5E01_06665 [Rathayibacter iranicus]
MRFGTKALVVASSALLLAGVGTSAHAVEMKANETEAAAVKMQIRFRRSSQKLLLTKVKLFLEMNSHLIRLRRFRCMGQVPC